MTTASLRSRPGGFSTNTGRLPVGTRVRQLWVYRRILTLLVRRDLKIRYSGSALGYVWTVLDPLLMTLVYWFVFAEIFKRDAGADYRPYMLYLVTGQLPWFWFMGSITGTMRSLRGEAQMVRSTNVPRELWVMRTVIAKGAEYAFGLPVLAIFALAYTRAPIIDIVFLPIAWVLEFTLLLGFGLMLAPAAVLLRDLERVIPLVVRVLYFASPVLYSITRLPQNLQFIYQFNPTVGFLELSHAMFFGAALHWDYVWHSAIWSVGVLVIGIVVFNRLERTVLKEI